MQTTPDMGFDRLVGTDTICRLYDNIHKETLYRRVRRGEFPAPDRVLGGRYLWFESTVRRELDAPMTEDAPLTGDSEVASIARAEV